MAEQLNSTTHLSAQERITNLGIDLSVLSAKEIVDLYALAAEYEETVDIGTPWEVDAYGLRERLHFTFESLPEADSGRAKELFHAFANSPRATDRETLTNHLIISLTKVDHDAGVTLWDRLIRDSDKDVRGEAERMLHEMLYEAAGPPYDRNPSTDTWFSGMHFIARLDEARLNHYTGLTREDAYNLLESYAYAENGQYVYDLGREALSKLITAQPHQVQAGPGGL